jgi:hypothetical protein
MNRNTSSVLAALAFVAGCGGAPRPTGGGAGAGGTRVVAPERAALKLEAEVVVARGSILAKTAAGDWQELRQGASLAGVRELQVARRGAIVALGHGDAAGRLWLRAGSIVRLGQDVRGVYVEMRTGRARLRRTASALPAFVDAATGPTAIDGDYLLEARSDGATELTPTGARPELADWSLALDRADDGAGVGRLEAPGRDAAHPELLALRRVKVDVRTAGDLAITSVEHTFHNPSDQNREATFRFPVPEGALLTGLAMEVHGEMMEGEIVEREKAREVYEKIVDSMQDPALLEWEEGNWFKLRVFPVEAQADKRVIIRYASPLVHGAGGWEYGYALATPDAPIGALTVTVDGKVVADEQQVATGVDLAIPVAADKVPAVMRETRDDGVYTAVRIPLPAAASQTAVADGPRKVAVIVDTSRSALEGKALALELVQATLGELSPEDAFVVLASDVAVTPHAKSFTPVTADAITGAIGFLGAIEPDGASDLQLALDSAAALRPTDVIYVGDGIPTWGARDTAALGRAADAIHAPIHAGLVGKGANSDLWAELAGRTGGRAVAVKRSLDARRFALAAGHDEAPRFFAARIEAPAGATVFPAGARTIYAGDALVALIKTPADQPVPTSVVMTGYAGDKLVRETVALTGAAKVEHVAQRWAAYQLAALEAAGAPREDIVKTSQDFGLMSRYTSLLVLENDEAYKQFQIERKKAAEAAKLAAQQAQQTAAPQITGGDLDTLGARDASLSPDEIQPGDPEIKIPAPADARSVVVSFSFGETKLAVWDADANAWMARFLIDKDTPDGEYQVRITITHADGRVEVRSLPYTVDTQPPAVEVKVAAVAGGYRFRARQLPAGDTRRRDADRVEIALPDGTVLELARTGWGRFEGVWQTEALAQPATVRVVVRDRALNLAASELVVGGN